MLTDAYVPVVGNDITMFQLLVMTSQNKNRGKCTNMALGC